MARWPFAGRERGKKKLARAQELFFFPEKLKFVPRRPFPQRRSSAPRKGQKEGDTALFYFLFLFLSGVVAGFPPLLSFLPELHCASARKRRGGKKLDKALSTSPFFSRLFSVISESSFLLLLLPNKKRKGESTFSFPPSQIGSRFGGFSPPPFLCRPRRRLIGSIATA